MYVGVCARKPTINFLRPLKIRERFQKAALKQERSYNNWFNYREYSVLYWYPVKAVSKGVISNEFVIVECLSSTVYRIQKTTRAKSLVVNHDVLKPVKLRELVETAWAKGVSKKESVCPVNTQNKCCWGRGSLGRWVTVQGI